MRMEERIKDKDKGIIKAINTRYGAIKTNKLKEKITGNEHRDITEDKQEEVDLHLNRDDRGRKEIGDMWDSFKLCDM